MSASAIADALKTMLSAASAFGAQGVALDDYVVLERVSGCACVIQPVGFTNEFMTFGSAGGDRTVHEIGLECYVKDTGDPRRALAGMWQVEDLVKDVISGDRSCQGTAQSLRLSRGARLRDTYVEAGGATWLPYYMTVLAEEF